MRGCSTSEAKRREIGEMFLRRKLDILALSETKLKGKAECDFGVVSGRESGVEEGWAREGVVLLLSDRVAGGITEWKEVSSRWMWVKVKLGIERWVFVSAYGPGSERSEEEREHFLSSLSECIESFGEQCNVHVGKNGPWCSGGASTDRLCVDLKASGGEADGCAGVERGGWRNA